MYIDMDGTYDYSNSVNIYYASVLQVYFVWYFIHGNTPNTFHVDGIQQIILQHCQIM